VEGLIDLIAACYRVELPERDWLEQLGRAAAAAAGPKARALACVCDGLPEALRGPLSVMGNLYLINGCDGAGRGVVLAVLRKRPLRRNALLARVAVHLAAAWRVRRLLERDAETALTRREQEVLAQAALGHHNKLIAYDLGVAHSTVRVLLHRAAAKLGAGSRGEAVRRFTSTRTKA
jgi:DNA-binding CsgD family transcriptional regulator